MGATTLANHTAWPPQRPTALHGHHKANHTAWAPQRWPTTLHGRHSAGHSPHRYRCALAPGPVQVHGTAGTHRSSARSSRIRDNAGTLQCLQPGQVRVRALRALTNTKNPRKREWVWVQCGRECGDAHPKLVQTSPAVSRTILQRAGKKRTGSCGSQQGHGRGTGCGQGAGEGAGARDTGRGT
jgi:hypothetical protein